MAISAPQADISFDANGGDPITDTKRVSFGGAYGMLPIPAYEGYAFRGWFTASTGGVEITDASIVGEVS